jgi:hypothetical protein
MPKAKQRVYHVLELEITGQDSVYPILDRTERGPRGLINRKRNLIVCVDNELGRWKRIATCHSLAQAANVANASHNFARRNGDAKRFKIAEGMR